MKRFIFLLLLFPALAWGFNLKLLDDYAGPSYNFRDTANLLALNKLLLFYDDIGTGSSTGNKILLETGDKLLLETGDKLLME